MKQRRKSSRFKASINFLCSAGRQEGVAELRDLSVRGALLTGLPWTPKPASLCSLVLEAAPDRVLRGRVVRFVHNGFAIAFEGLDSAAESLLDDLASM